MMRRRLTGETSIPYNGVLAAVPFVDVVTTMLDADIPLTSGEWAEWGPWQGPAQNFVKPPGQDENW